MLNILMRDYSNTDELVSFCLSLALLILYVVLFPVWLAYKLFKASPEVLNSEEFKRKFGSAYEEKKDNLQSLMFEFIFMIRRFLLVMSVVFLQKYPVMQWIVFNYFSLAVSIFKLKFI